MTDKKANRPGFRSKLGTAVIKDAGLEDHIAQARILAERVVPSFIPGLRASTPVLDENCPTIGIDRYWRTYWNPKCVQFLLDAAKAVSATSPCNTCKATSHHPLAYLGGLWIHEIGHRVFAHADRFDETGWQDYGKGNVAMDLEMNDDIPGLAQGAVEFYKTKGGLCPLLCLPSMINVDPQEYVDFVLAGSQAFKAAHGDKGFFDIAKPHTQPVPKGMAAIPFGAFVENTPVGPLEWVKLDPGKIWENYYEMMPEPTLFPKQSGQGEEGDGEGCECEGDGSGESKPGKGKGKGKGGKQATPGLDELNDHGSGAMGDQRPWEQGDPKDPGNAPGISDAETKAIRRDVATNMKDPSKQCGTNPAGWDVWADTVLKTPKVRWEDKLRAMARQAINRIRGDRLTTFRRLSRASIVQNCAVIKPSTYEITPVVYVITDTSGSMGAGKGSPLERALSETEAILKSSKVKTYFIDCDANVYGNAQEVTSIRHAQVHGGGGTDMGVGVRAALKSKPKADVIVVLTDGFTPWWSPDEGKGVKIITAIIGPHMPAGVPPWTNPILVDISDE